MLLENLELLFARDLEKLKTEISSYKDENNLWQIRAGILNSGGNLALHLVGNLKHFVGLVLGEFSYSRERDKEFSNKNIPVADIIRSIDETITVVTATLSKLTHDDIARIYPQKPLGTEMTTANFLLHLYAHLNYHLGQINYHRRIVEAN
ncbi:MAG TPA: DinB family protein [Panacibacter sp.]|nr:DinB family protein [Panacibacter sp.]HNP46043.1 DinB family protein [Panacibacter sp.]